MISTTAGKTGQVVLRFAPEGIGGLYVQRRNPVCNTAGLINHRCSIILHHRQAEAFVKKCPGNQRGDNGSSKEIRIEGIRTMVV
jgi:hypothetical protein